jgi:ribonuclease R
LRVQVSRVDLDGRKIDFRLVNDAAVDAALPRPARKSGDDSARDELEGVERRDRASKAKRATAVAARKRGGKPATAAPRKTKASRKKAV